MRVVEFLYRKRQRSRQVIIIKDRLLSLVQRMSIVKPDYSPENRRKTSANG